MYKHILLPTDGSKLATSAARAGVELAKTCGARVTGLFVAPPATPVVYRRLLPVRYMTPEQHAALTERASRRYLGAIEKAAAAAGVPCDSVSVIGDFVADAILRTAARRHCDLIVMASHARRGLAAVLVGSETQKVLAQASIPVLVHR
jgi:nucleotide-binding universal stress UspA family protein